MLINFIRHQVTLGLIEVRKVATTDNIADVLMKPLARSKFAPKAAQLLGIDIDGFSSVTMITLDSFNWDTVCILKKFDFLNHVDGEKVV